MGGNKLCLICHDVVEIGVRLGLSGAYGIMGLTTIAMRRPTKYAKF